MSSKSLIFSPESLHEQLKASAKSVLLTNIIFKEAMYPDEEEQKIREKYKPINPQFQQFLSQKKKSMMCNGYITNNSSENLDGSDDMPKPKVILFPPEKVEINWKETRRIGPGLCNLGNTCFLNSVLQTLTYTAPLVNFISTDNHRANCETVGFCMLCELRNHIFRVLKHNQQAGPIRPLAIVQKLSYIGRQFKFGRQEDAHEFLRYVIDGLQKSCLAGKPKLDKMSRESTVINQIFGGFYRSQVICLGCKNKSNTYDPMLEMNLDIKEANTIENALRRSVRPEKLDGENKYQCDRCRGKRPAIKRSTIHKSPNIFTVQFKRFDFNRIIGGKITKHISYTEELNLRPFMSITEGQPVLYGLYGVLVHSGFSCNSGHYYCYVKAPNGAWYEMNDSRVSQVSLKTVLNTEAYLLFYMRKQNKDEKVMNGNCNSNQQIKPNYSKTTTAIATGNVKNIKEAQKNQDPPKERKPFPKLIPLNFYETGKVSFKISKTPAEKDIQNVDNKTRRVSSDKNHTSLFQPTKKEQSFSRLGSMEQLRLYDSDESNEEETKVHSEKNDTKGVDTPNHRQTLKENTTNSLPPSSTPTVETNSNICINTETFSTVQDSTSKTDEISNKLKKCAIENSFNDSEEVKFTGLNTIDTDCKLMLDRNGEGVENKENVSSSCSTKSKNTKRQISSPVKSFSKSMEENKNRTSHSHTKSFLFSPPLVPAMRPWMPIRHSTIPRNVFRRSMSAPDPSVRKQQATDNDSATRNDTEKSSQQSKWHAFEREKSEHFYGIMTSPAKESTRRERTNSLNSEASSVASVTSKAGEWEVHEKEQDDFPTVARIPERQFAGWDVEIQGKEAKEANSKEDVNQNAAFGGKGASLEYRNKRKKKKRKRSRGDIVDDSLPQRYSESRKRTRRSNHYENSEGENDERGKEGKRKKKKRKKSVTEGSDRARSNSKVSNASDKKRFIQNSDDRERVKQEEKNLECSKNGQTKERQLISKHRNDKKHLDRTSDSSFDKDAFVKSDQRQVSCNYPKRVPEKGRKSNGEREKEKEEKTSIEKSVRHVSKDRRHSASSERSSVREMSREKEWLNGSKHQYDCGHRGYSSKDERGMCKMNPKEKDLFNDTSSETKKRLNGSHTNNYVSKRRRSQSVTDDSSDSESHYKRCFKKSKSKNSPRSNSRESEQNKNLKIHKDAPAKYWDDNKCTLPEVSTRGAEVVDSLYRDKARALGSKVKSWVGGENELDSTRADDERRRKRDKWDDEYDEGRKKKVKSHKKSSKYKAKYFGTNPFQKVQNSRKNKESVRL